MARAGTPPPAAPPLLAARQLAWLVLKSEEQRTPDENTLWARLQQHDELQQVAALVRQGMMLIRQRQAADLDAWLQACRASASVELRNCAEWLQRDSAAVKAALILPWSKGTSLLSVAAIVLYAMTAFAQSAKDPCGPTPVIPLTSEEPPAKIITYPPLAEPLASRVVAIIQYCTQNLHLVPVFGPKALAISPRFGHLHVTVDDAAWVWADASGQPIILMGLPPGPHKVLMELADANHHILDKSVITFVVPEKNAAEKPH